MQISFPELAKMIDHAILHPVLTDNDLINGCRLALHFQTASVCVKPYAVSLAAGILHQSTVKTGTVIGFPHGSAATSVKVAESIQAVNDGASELDMVVNIGKVLSRDWAMVKADIEAVQNAAISNGVILKVIFENSFLNDNLKIQLCNICSELQVAFVKTSTGFGFVKNADGSFYSGGATVEDIRLMRKHSAPGVHIKASGGIRTLKDALEMISNGATRIGTASTETILKEYLEKDKVSQLSADKNADTGY